jgi:hypothetical protein
MERTERGFSETFWLVKTAETLLRTERGFSETFWLVKTAETLLNLIKRKNIMGGGTILILLITAIFIMIAFSAMKEETIEESFGGPWDRDRLGRRRYRRRNFY